MRRLLLLTLVATMFAACADVGVEEVTNQDASAKVVYAYIDDLSVDTRVELNDKKQTVWTANDEIYIFSDGSLDIYRFQGKTGDRSGSFKYTEGYTFDSSDIDFGQYYYAIYLSDWDISVFNDNSPAFFTTLPATQEYKEHSYGLKTNAMLGISENNKDFKFINLLGYLRLSLTGSKAVESIVISGKNGEILASQLYIHKSGWVGIYDEAQSQSITLDCGDGVQLTDEPTEFYFTMIPQTLSNGFNVTVKFTDGSIYTKSTSKSITFERNTIQPMKSLDTGGDVEWQTITIDYMGTEVAAPIFNYGSIGNIYWGDGNESEVNSLESYVYSDGKISHTITVKTLNATQFYIDSCSGISKIDLSNF